MYNVTTTARNFMTQSVRHGGRAEYSDLAEARDFASELHGSQIDEAMRKHEGSDYRHSVVNPIGFVRWALITSILDERGTILATVATKIRED